MTCDDGVRALALCFDVLNCVMASSPGLGAVLQQIAHRGAQVHSNDFIRASMSCCGVALMYNVESQNMLAKSSSFRACIRTNAPPAHPLSEALHLLLLSVRKQQCRCFEASG